MKVKNRLKLWFSVCKLFCVKPHEMICKNHFNPDDFHYGKRINLKKSAVPHCHRSVSKLYQTFKKMSKLKLKFILTFLRKMK